MAYSSTYNHSFCPSAPEVNCAISVPGKTELSPRTFPALIDSGADITIVPQKIATALGLEKVDRISVAGFKDLTPTRQEDVYAAKVSIPPMGKEVYRVLVTKTEYGLVGRDLINHWTVTLKGKAGIVEIEEGQKPN